MSRLFVRCQVPVIQLLLAFGADVNVTDAAGQTALDHAQQRVVDGWRRNCSVVYRFDAEAALHVLEEWCEPLAELAEPKPHAREEVRHSATLCGVDAKAVIRGMRERDTKRMHTIRARQRSTQCAREPEPEPEGL